MDQKQLLKAIEWVIADSVECRRHRREVGSCTTLASVSCSSLLRNRPMTLIVSVMSVLAKATKSNSQNMITAACTQTP